MTRVLAAVALSAWRRRRRLEKTLAMALGVLIVFDAHGTYGWRGSVGLVLSLAIAFVYVALLKRAAALGDRRDGRPTA